MLFRSVSQSRYDAPKTFKAQQEAHFGVSSESCDSCSIRYLGSYRSDLEIGEVIATSNYDSEVASNYLGQVAGKGVCAGQKMVLLKCILMILVLSLVFIMLNLRLSIR